MGEDSNKSKNKMKTTITRQRLVALLSALLLCVGAQAQDDMPTIDGLM